MTVKTRAVVLHTLKYGERKVIVELLCMHRGCSEDTEGQGTDADASADDAARRGD